MNINDIPKMGLVYRLTVGDYHYTGSTINTIHWRVMNHQSAYKSGGEEQTRKFYKHLLSVGGWDDVKVHILESNIEEEKLKQRENSYINKEDPFSLNTYSVISTIVPVEPKKRTAQRKVYDRTYYQLHKEKLKQYRMEHYKMVKSDPEKSARMLEVSRQAQARYLAKKKLIV